MIRKYSPVLFTVFALMASAPVAATAQATATVMGTVRNATTNAPVSDIDVRIYTAAGATVGSGGRTNASGLYSVTGLGAGTYYLNTSSDRATFDLIHQCFSARPCAGYSGFYAFSGFPVKSADAVTLAAGQTFIADFVLQPGGRRGPLK